MHLPQSSLLCSSNCSFAVSYAMDDEWMNHIESITIEEFEFMFGMRSDPPPDTSLPISAIPTSSSTVVGHTLSTLTSSTSARMFPPAASPTGLPMSSIQVTSQQTCNLYACFFHYCRFFLCIILLRALLDSTRMLSNVKSMIYVDSIYASHVSVSLSLFHNRMCC